MSLFNLSVSPSREHPNFRALRLSPYHDAAKALMDSLFTRMGDPNGGFAGDFQTEGFYARLTELAWFAYLEEANAEIDRCADGPDFLVSVSGHRVGLEITTANPRDGDDRDISMQKIELLSPDEIIKRTRGRCRKRNLKHASSDGCHKNQQVICATFLDECSPI